MKVICLLLILCATQISAAPLNLRHPALSPDGSQICFSYQGDLWVVSSEGGRAERLTVHIGYESYPSWSPDGKYIAFSGDRYAGYDVFVIPAEGGQEIRVTYHSTDDFVSAWSPDSKKILFTSKRELHRETIFEVDAFGGRVKPLLIVGGMQGRLSPDGKKLLFCRGYVPWWRKGYRGTADCDLYIKNLKSGKIEQITAHRGNDLEGFWLPNSEEIIYLSDSTGSYNVFRKNLFTGITEELTHHRLHAAFPSLSADGSLIAYELDGEIFLYDLVRGQGRKLIVEAPSGAKINQVEKLIYDSGATEMVVSPNGAMIAFVIHGEIFCLDIKTNIVRQLTDSPSNDCQISWSNNSRELVFASNRKGNIDVYLLRSSDPSQPSLALSYKRERTCIVSSGHSEEYPLISPDNSKIAFIRSQSGLIVTDKMGLAEEKIADDGTIGSVCWSPDGRYLLFTQLDSDWNNDIYLADVESRKVVNVTMNPGHYQNPHFSPDGRFIYFTNDQIIYYLFLKRILAEMSPSQREIYFSKNDDGVDNASPPVQIDFDQLSERVTRLTGPVQVKEVIVSLDSRSFIYTGPANSVWSANIDGSEPERLLYAVDTPQKLQFTTENMHLHFMDVAGRFYSLDMDGSNLQSHSYRAELTIDRGEEFLEVFNEAWQVLRDRFYDQSLYGIDWNDVKNEYSPRVKAATERNDLLDIVQEMLGELNASHVAIWPKEDQCEETGYLGIIPDFDENYSWLKVKTVLPNSPASMVTASLKPKEKIVFVNGKEIKRSQNYYQHLEGTAGKLILLEVLNREGISRPVTITPLSEDDYKPVEHDFWAQNKRELTDDLSDNRIGYLHLDELSYSGLECFREQLARIAGNKNGLIIDIRDNFGGTVHDQLLELLSAKSYVSRRPRHGKSGTDSKVAFSGPIVLLINEGTSSDAEILAHGFRELNLGTIVGVTTYGAVIGTESHVLIDGSVLKVPSVGWYNLSGENLEHRGVKPDLEALLDLTRMELGKDSQLERAVALLLQKIE